MRDALYIALDKWDDFLCEPGDRQCQPDLFEQLVDVRPNLARIAVPEALLQSEVATLPNILRYFFHLEVLFIIVDAQPDLQPADKNKRCSGGGSLRAHREGRSSGTTVAALILGIASTSSMKPCTS